MKDERDKREDTKAEQNAHPKTNSNLNPKTDN